jgi:hypothetical protein
MTSTDSINDAMYNLHFITDSFAPFPIQWCSTNDIVRLVAVQDDTSLPALVPLQLSTDKLIIHNAYSPPGNMTARTIAVSGVVMYTLVAREFFTFGDTNVFDVNNTGGDNIYTVALATGEQLVIDTHDLCNGNYPLLFVDTKTIADNTDRFVTGKLKIKIPSDTSSSKMPTWGWILIGLAILVFIGLCMYVFRKTLFGTRTGKSQTTQTSSTESTQSAQSTQDTNDGWKI